MSRPETPFPRHPPPYPPPLAGEGREGVLKVAIIAAAVALATKYCDVW
jgi:hypothetical protein